MINAPISYTVEQEIKKNIMGILNKPTKLNKLIEDKAKC